VTSMAERAMSQAERTQIQADRAERAMGLHARVGERPRDLQRVSLVMLDGTEIKGVLHRAPGTRTLDYLNRQAEAFVAMTDATLTNGERTDFQPFVAINKVHIVHVIEDTDPE
jgi:hypothetical protein